MPTPSRRRRIGGKRDRDRWCENRNAGAGALRTTGEYNTMDKLIVKALTFKADRDGVTALEYGIIASILGLVLVGIFTSFGSTLKTLFSNVSTSI